MKVFINPGHMPGVDAGAVNYSMNLQECDIALRISNRVKGYLEAVGYDVKLLQSDNLAGESPRYENVTDSANKWGADVFVSIHCNSVENPTARGCETLVYSMGGDAEDLAYCIQKQVIDTLKAIDKKFDDRGIKVRNKLAVLRCTKMPAVMVETAFISNELDANLLVNKEDDISRAIARGITDYFSA